ncbi:Acetyltransferase (GNAT) domain-containing protein [Chitinophaga terrae (ex Kim and Jung 2007)]|uniref:Acetyltransferase (GNAT) domain-containing protein n=1 Tax=Chitinophaga terrae (ex Kim and Jung 2007) TaxID=408074 RepID=A0A1H4DPQ8_9BACT|nr:GNAT family N-acetyltransferase [Chitinophaga terrae (ex Kim and Jung 2007)]GEP91064.1 N-acetyltransferase [Chitinophaga terrae (ex Kim and Jung 2007)]SEA74763.1 Acetyltransferase (GNAT) domain-containing protein [Chitinophaga terrae (ex Kim and Jung 2007)]
MIHLYPATTARPYIRQLYIQAFPENERRGWPAQMELLSTGKLKLLEVRKGEEAVGFVFYWQLSAFSFIEHFAIDPGTRGGGIGSAVMTQLDLALKQIVLEVEPPLTEMAIRRIGFYERLGYRTFPDTYYQPPYKLGDPPLELRLMYKGLPEEISFEKVKEELYSFVYQQ